MASIFKILRSIFPHSRPPADIESAGSLYVNFADAQLGIMDEAGFPLDLLGIRFYKDTAGYVVDDIVAYEGRVYQCILEHDPEPFDGSKWNDLTADPETNHNVLVFRDADNSHPQSAITDLLLDQAVQNEAIDQNTQNLVDHETVHNPHQKMDWVYPYVLGPLYKKHSVVNDNGWLRVANQDTSERAAPQPVGDPVYLLPEAPIWIPHQYLGNIKAGIHIFDPALIYEIKKYRVWVPTVTADAHYRIIFEDRITGVVTLGKAFNGDILDAPGYIETSIPPKYILPGDDYLLYMLMSNSATNQEYNHPWLYQGTSNQDIDPGIGNTARRGDHSRLNISSTDADGTNRDSELGSVIVGSTFSITSEINASRFIKYEVIGLRTNMTGWWLFEVALIDTGVLGEPTISERCQTYFVNPVLASTDYVEAPDIHLDLPAVTGILKLGEGVTTENNSSFGMDIKVQEMTASAHWDPAANSIEGGSGDTGGLDDHTLDFHSNVNAPTAQNDQRLAWDDATGMWVPKSSTSGLGIVSAHYKMGLPPNATPLSGDVSRDNADPALVTFLYLSTTDDNGDLRGEFWGEMKAGDWINIRKSNDLDINENYDISGPGVDNGAYWTIPVTPYANAGVLSDNDKVTVLWRIRPNYPHSVLVDVLPDDHHPQSHVHDGADGSGVIVHANIINRDVADAHSRASITDIERVFTDRLKGFAVGGGPYVNSIVNNGDTDLNNYTETGMWYVHKSSMVNGPSNATVDGQLLNMFNSATYGSQVYFENYTARIFVRGLIGGAWNGWEEVGERMFYQRLLGYSNDNTINRITGDLNTFTTNRDGTISTFACTNYPPIGNYGYFSVRAGENSGVGMVYQTAIGLGTTSVYQRSRTNAAWSAWVRTDRPPDTSWNIVSSFFSGWAAYDADAYPVRYKRYGDNTVRLDGLIRNGTLGGTVFLLPSEYRPKYNSYFACFETNGFANGFVLTNGNVSIKSSTNTGGYFSLSDVTFSID